MDEVCSRLITPGSHADKVIGIITSGEDRYGMNAAVRASVLIANYIGSKIYIIHKGFSGLIEGGDNIIAADWRNVIGIIYQGGTIFGSGPTKALQNREARLKAAYNLIKKKITYLIIIGGTNSMLISDILKIEWTELLNELVATKRITPKQIINKDILHIIYIPSSVDNRYGADVLTIGRDSALHRIIRAIDDISSTAHSEQRIYILEIMGIRNGYLALVAAICCEANYILIPEYPPKSDWHHKLCEQITLKLREDYKSYSIVVIAEGAIDSNGERIRAVDVKNIIFQKLQKEAFITVLGDVQIGGFPSAFDRILATRLGSEAVRLLVNSNADTVSSVLTLDDNKTITIPLPELMKRAAAVTEAIENKNWELVVRLNGQTFENKLQRYLMIATMKPSRRAFEGTRQEYQFAVMCIGAPVCGTNAVIECFVRNAVYLGHTALGIQNGIDGFIAGDIKQLGWSEVSHLVSQNGVCLGAKRTLPIDKYNKIAARIKEFNIQGLLIIGGFDAYYTCLLLCAQRSKYSEFRIPLVVIPATISNNVPGTEISVGSDTALNQITITCDEMSRTHSELFPQVYIAEIIGGFNGYLTTMAGIAVGAEAAYIFEEEFKVPDLKKDVSHFISKISHGGIPRFLVMHHEKASENYNCDFIHRLYAEESNGLYHVHTNILGNMQQAGNPSPFDRTMGMKMAVMSVDWLINQIKKNINSIGVIQCDKPDSACILGLIGRYYKFTPVMDLIDDVDFEHRNTKKIWWMNLRPLLKILGNRSSLSHQSGVLINKDCSNCEEGKMDIVK